MKSMPEKLDERLRQLQLKIDLLADYGFVGRVFEQHILTFKQMRTMKRETAAVVVALLFERMVIDIQSVDDALERIRKNDEDVWSFTRKYKQPPTKI